MTSPDQFIQRISQTDPATWQTDEWTDKDDALRDIFGHLGCRWSGPNRTGHYIMTSEAHDLQTLFSSHGYLPSMVADGRDTEFQQPHPKDRLIACLERIKEEEEL